jgi:hypothetical protein
LLALLPGLALLALAALTLLALAAGALAALALLLALSVLAGLTLARGAIHIVISHGNFLRVCCLSPLG